MNYKPQVFVSFLLHFSIQYKASIFLEKIWRYCYSNNTIDLEVNPIKLDYYHVREWQVFCFLKQN